MCRGPGALHARGRASPADAPDPNPTPAQGAFLNDTHVLDTAAWRWRPLAPVGSPPAARHAHACCVAAGRLLLHGGSNAAQSFDGVIEVSTDLGRELSRRAPLPVAGRLPAHALPVAWSIFQRRRVCNVCKSRCCYRVLANLGRVALRVTPELGGSAHARERARPGRRANAALSITKQGLVGGRLTRCRPRAALPRSLSDSPGTAAAAAAAARRAPATPTRARPRRRRPRALAPPAPTPARPQPRRPAARLSPACWRSWRTCCAGARRRTRRRSPRARPRSQRACSGRSASARRSCRRRRAAPGRPRSMQRGASHALFRRRRQRGRPAQARAC